METTKFNDKKSDKKKVKKIIDDLERLVQSEDLALITLATHAEDGTEVKPLYQYVKELRLLGMLCEVPSTCTGRDDGTRTYEILADIVRQGKEYLQPFRTWVKQHIGEVVSWFLSGVAIVISLIALCV